jgi:hypothetical protein
MQIVFDALKSQSFADVKTHKFRWKVTKNADSNWIFTENEVSIPFESVPPWMYKENNQNIAVFSIVWVVII